MTAFFNVKTNDDGTRQGYLGECDRTEVIFQNPGNRPPKNMSVAVSVNLRE